MTDLLINSIHDSLTTLIGKRTLQEEQRRGQVQGPQGRPGAQGQAEGVLEGGQRAEEGREVRKTCELLFLSLNKFTLQCAPSANRPWMG